MHPTAPTPERSERPVSNPAGRFYRATTALTIFAMLFGGLLLLTAPAVSARSNSPVTTAWVNFRTGPSTSDAVIMVLPDGTSVEVTGDPENGFYPVTAKGSSGFVSTDFISIDGGSTDDSESEPVPDDSDSGSEAPVDTGNSGSTMYVIDGRLNLRDGPGTNSGVITVMPGGAAVTTTGQSSSGFLSVSYNGREGWAFAEFLSNSGGGGGEGEMPEEEDTSGDGSVPVGDTVSGSAVVADGPLNLRAGPSTSTSILNVMPTGASLELMGSIQSGFHPVRYQGQTGWAFAEFVGVGGGTTPDPEPAPEEEDEDSGSDGSVPVPGSDVVGTAMVIAGALNLRSGPSTSTEIVLVMGDGSQVSLLGDPQNGFYPVSYNGSTGWAFSEYLSVGGDEEPVPDDGGEEEPAPDPGDSGDVGNGDTNGDGSYTRDELVAIIEVAAARYGQPVYDMIRVAGCESVWDPRAVNSSSGASGLFQFMPGTWLTTPFADQDIFDPVANANAAAWMWSVGRRNEWSCQ